MEITRDGQTPTYPQGWIDREISPGIHYIGYKTQFIFYAVGVCYEKGYVNVGSPLNVYHNGKRDVNVKQNIPTVEDCIEECRKWDDCKWFNWVSEGNLRNTCWLKTGRGNRKSSAGHGQSYTGHRDSSEECPGRGMFTPILYQTGPAEEHNNNIFLGETNNNWFKSLLNPCPNGVINTNCYSTGACVRCCTGEQPGSDNTPACTH